MKYSFILLCALAGAVYGGEWRQWNGKEYYVAIDSGETDKSWHAARDWCNLQGGDIASVLTVNEKDQLVAWSSAAEYTGDLWNGLNQYFDRDSWSWASGEALGNTYWASGFPKDENEYGALHLCAYQKAKEDGSWYNGHCDDPKGFICKRDIGDTDPKTPPGWEEVDGYCPAGYFGDVGNKCFKVVHLNQETGKTHWDAQRECRRGPGRLPDLASINSELEQAYITAQLQNVTGGVWIGYTRPTGYDKWRWGDNSPNGYENWGPGEPRGTDDHCAEIWILPGPPGTWNNIQCSSHRGYVCQTFKDPDNVINTPPPTTPSQCPAGFIPYWYGCYKVNETPMSWEMASQVCQSEGGQLASIMAEAENAALQIPILEINSQAWIGLQDNPGQATGTGLYSWMDHWYVLYTNWGYYEPIRVYQGGCVEMKTDGKWYDQACSVQMPSICKTTYVDPPTTPSHLEGVCPDQEDNTASSAWETYGEHCYYFETDVTETWYGAQSACFEKHPLSALASVHSFLENDWIYKHLDKRYPYTGAWIGMYRTKQERDMAWIDNTPVQFINWAPNEPNGAEAGEDCVEMYTQNYAGKWNDHRCNEWRGYVCKAPKMPAATKPPNVPGTCPSDKWIPYGTLCHLFEPDHWVTWSKAQEICKEEGGEAATLASIHSRTDSRHIHDAMLEFTNLPEHRRYWIGLYKQPGEDVDAFKWTDGTPLDYTRWAQDEPNNWEGIEDCVEVYPDSGLWNDIYCSEPRGFVCQVDKELEGASGSDLSGGAIAGIVIGSIVAVVAIVLLALFLVNYFGSSSSSSSKPSTGGGGSMFSFSNPLSSGANNPEKLQEEVEQNGSNA